MYTIEELINKQLQKGELQLLLLIMKILKVKAKCLIDLVIFVDIIYQK